MKKNTLTRQVGGNHYQRLCHSARRVYKQKQVAFCGRQRYKIYSESEK